LADKEWDEIRRQAAEAAKAKRDKAYRDKVRGEQEAQEARDQKMNKAFEEEAKALFGDYIEDIEDGINDYQGPSDADIAAAAKAIRDARKAAEGGMFSSGDPAKARKILNQNKGVIKKAQKKAPKKGGCTLFALIILVAIGSAVSGSVWGAVEIISALAN
jgi:hypothetical protein